MFPSHNLVLLSTLVLELREACNWSVLFSLVNSSDEFTRFVIESKPNNSNKMKSRIKESKQEKEMGEDNSS